MEFTSSIALSVLEWQRLVLSSWSTSFSRSPEKIFGAVDVQLSSSETHFHLWPTARVFVLVKMRRIAVVVVAILFRRHASDKFQDGGGHWGLQYRGIGQFFIRYFGNFNFKMRYCGVLRICGMRYFRRFGQRYLIQKKLFYTVSDPFLVWLVSDRLGNSGNKLKDVMVKKCWRAYATSAIRKLFENLCLQSLALTKVSFNDFPLR